MTDNDHNLLDKFLGHVLESYKKEAKEKSKAIADIAHVCAALDHGNIDAARLFMNALMKEDGIPG